MPAPTPCPVSNLDRALSSYVNSREETLKIRRTLAKYFSASFRPVNSSTQNQHANHQCPQNMTAASTNPPDLKGVRRNYLDALRAKHAAQSRQRELQAALDEMQNRHILESPDETESQYDNEIVRNHVALVRQRRAFAELQVIQDSLEKLLNANPVTGSTDPRALVTKAIGEQPDLPAERLEPNTMLDNDGPMILKVKKEVLEAKSKMERATTARTEAQKACQRTPRLREQVHALNCARVEIVEWVQGELAKLEEESGFIDDASPVKRSTGPASPVDLASSEALIRGTYEDYIASRAAVIKTHESVQAQPVCSSTNSQHANVGTNGAEPEEQPHPANLFTKISPYLPNLMRIDNNERALLQQTIYLQAQISSADEETVEHLSRLAGESHLLPSGSKSVESWGKYAAEAEEANNKFLQERVQDSRQEINRIAAIVELCSLQSQVLSSA